MARNREWNPYVLRKYEYSLLHFYAGHNQYEYSSMYDICCIREILKPCSMIPWFICSSYVWYLYAYSSYNHHIRVCQSKIPVYGSRVIKSKRYWNLAYVQSWTAQFDNGHKQLVIATTGMSYHVRIGSFPYKYKSVNHGTRIPYALRRPSPD